MKDKRKWGDQVSSDELTAGLATLSRQQLRNVVGRAVRDHYAHVRGISRREFTSQYFGVTSEQAAVEKVLARVQMMARHLPLEASASRVLDVGVGTGSLPVVLSALGFEVYGLDDDGGGQRQASILAQRFPTLKMQVCALEADDYPHKDNTFDVVTSFDVIEHLPGSPQYYLAEIYRVLKPGGVFFLSNPNVASLANRAQILTGRSIYHALNEWFDPPGDDDSNGFSGHWREYTAGELVYMVEVTGFRVVEAGCRSRLSISRARFSNALQKIAYAAADTLTSTIFRRMADEAYVVCRKPAR